VSFSSYGIASRMLPRVAPRTLIVTAASSYLAAHVGAPPIDGVVHGYAEATTLAAILLGCVAVVTIVLVRTPKPEPH
jgi:hypothetical protein